ncbi:MAG: hypothetical protein J2P36_27020 [Ktedonobacteraceae bacterium]|nr:hypothetical protein [Ktedonobacteraceae bacterium]
MATHEVSSVKVAQSAVETAGLGERKLRRISAWLNLFFLIAGGLGAVWDREWHAYVGRDQFWTPPHTLIYVSVTAGGLIALTLVLLETMRYRRKVAGVSDTSTVRVFWLFHAPIGFVVSGFGALLSLISAPLDNYWHELYGIDIAMWAPFHMMGITGALIATLGMIYVFASEAAIDRQEQAKRRTFLRLTALEWGSLAVMASLMNFALTGFLQFPVVNLGPLHISTYPLGLVAATCFCFIAAIHMTRRPGAALLVTLMLFVHTMMVETFLPWWIRVAVAQQGLDYRIPGYIPYFHPSYAFLPAILLISALIVDGLAWRQLRKYGTLKLSVRRASLVGLVIVPPIVLLAPFMLQGYNPFSPIFLPQPGLTVPLSLYIEAFTGLALAVLATGAIFGLLGADFGDIWRWSKR